MKPVPMMSSAENAASVLTALAETAITVLNAVSVKIVWITSVSAEAAARTVPLSVRIAVKNAPTVPTRRSAEAAISVRTVQAVKETSATAVRPVRCVQNMFVSVETVVPSVWKQSVPNVMKNAKTAQGMSSVQTVTIV